jgi:hypothetical protein
MKPKIFPEQTQRLHQIVPQKVSFNNYKIDYSQFLGAVYTEWQSLLQILNLTKNSDMLAEICRFYLRHSCFSIIHRPTHRNQAGFQ